MKTMTTTPGLMALLVSAALSIACNNSVNPKDQVGRELERANIQDVNVDYDSSNQVVHLKGSVASATLSARAEEIAKTTAGPSRSVANELTVKGVDDTTANDMDGAIRRELNAKVANDRTLEQRSINFDVNNGVVTIKGDVRTDAERQKVVELTRTTANVRDVVNVLELDQTLKSERPAATSGREDTHPAREMRRDAPSAPAHGSMPEERNNPGQDRRR